MCIRDSDPSELEHRPLKRYESPASKLVLELGYSVDYEDEKEDFEPDEADTVEPVSYTHLDVYKRQCQSRGLQGPHGKSLCAGRSASAPVLRLSLIPI